MSALDKLLGELTSGDDRRAEAAIAGLDVHGAALLPALRPLLGSPDEDRRWWAVRALAEIDDPHTPPLLIQALEDPQPAVRQCAALGLRLRPDPRAVEPLIAHLDDPDHLVVSLASDALAMIGGEAVPRLLDVLQNGSPQARLEAVRALAIIADPRSLPALFAAYNEGSALMEYWANEGLERMGFEMVFFKP